METKTGNRGASAGFLLNPEGLFRLRDYSNDDPAELKALRGLLETSSPATRRSSPAA